MLLTQNLIIETPTSTASTLWIGGRFVCFVIEDGYQEIKRKEQSRIMGGRYEIIPRTYGPHLDLYRQRYCHEFVPELKGVPNYTNILFHIGNWAADTAGCLLPNMAVKYSATKDEVEGINSATAYKRLYRALSAAYDEGLRVFIDINRKP